MSTEATTGALLWRVCMKWRAAVDRALAPLGLTHAKYALLASLYGLLRTGAQPSQRQLADYAGLEAVYVSKLARALEEAGLLERTEDPTDPRTVRLRLTEQGADVVVRAIGVVGQLQEEHTAAIGGTRSARNRELVDTLRVLLGRPPAVHRRRADDTETAPQATLTGQDINMAARATRLVLDKVLAKEDTTYADWVALRTVAAGEPPTRHDALRSALSTRLDADADSISRLLRDLESRQLIQRDPTHAAVHIALTPSGHALLQRLGGAVAEATDRLYGDLDPDDLAAARRVLLRVTERAEALRVDTETPVVTGDGDASDPQ